VKRIGILVEMLLHEAGQVLKRRLRLVELLNVDESPVEDTHYQVGVVLACTPARCTSASSGDPGSRT
jgi:hypothetical protein